jgi:ubiquitin-activating enzyme E1-like protein 2
MATSLDQQPPAKRRKVSKVAPTEMDVPEIDDSLYSRQRYVLGDGAMQRMAKSHVFISGLTGLGIETAKNVALAGVKALTVHDTQVATALDLGSQFFLTEADVQSGANRAEASAPRLAELNPYTNINVSTADLVDGDLSFLNAYQCVVIVDAPLAVQTRVNEFCRNAEPQIRFVSGSVRGPFGVLFVDFGSSFEVVDSSGEELKESFVGDITQAENGVVTLVEGRLHGLEDGDVVTFREVGGMESLNDGNHVIKVISPSSFSIGDTRTLGPYTGGGICTQLHRRR